MPIWDGGCVIYVKRWDELCTLWTAKRVERMASNWLDNWRTGMERSCGHYKLGDGC